MLLLTASNEHQIPLAELTVPLMREYAKRHRLGFRYVPFAEPNVKEAYWKKIVLTLQAFDEGFDRVFWLDVDQAITNPEILPPDPIQGFNVSRDWGTDAKTAADFSMCGFIAHVNTRKAFQHVNDRHEEFIDGPFPEQTPMREYFSMNDYLYFGMPRRVLNAVPDEVSPGSVPEPWQPGDFAAHITMVDIRRRVEIFHEVMKRNK